MASNRRDLNERPQTRQLRPSVGDRDQFIFAAGARFIFEPLHQAVVTHRILPKFAMCDKLRGRRAPPAMG